jgi:DNA-binding transcriptional MocR family regulator
VKQEIAFSGLIPHGFTIIEDDYLGDPTTWERNWPPARFPEAVFPGSRVIVSDLSKCLLPALRVAGVSADERTIAKSCGQNPPIDIAARRSSNGFGTLP